MKNQFNPFLEKLKDLPGQKPPTIDELDPVVCLKCGNCIFDRYFKMYKLSALKTANGKEQNFNVPVYVCASCAEILDMSKNDNTVQEPETGIQEKEAATETKKEENKTENSIDKDV